MSTFIKNERTGKILEYPPYQCKLCGMWEVTQQHDICNFCGWEDDGIQNWDHDYEGGANKLSFNQYTHFWIENKERILKEEKPWKAAIRLSREYKNNIKK